MAKKLGKALLFTAVASAAAGAADVHAPGRAGHAADEPPGLQFLRQLPQLRPCDEVPPL